MELGTYVDELQRQLAAAAAAGSDETRETAGRLTTALDAAARLVLLEALGAAAAEITTELTPGSVDVRLRGREPEFVVTQAPQWDAPTEPTTPAAPVSSSTVDVEEGATTRTTLRLPDELKSRVEAAAAHAGVSVNTWLVRAIAATLDGGTRRTVGFETNGKRVTGWVR
ncbi:toxin-antitoxin system HicB family antitoxin [Planctomonas sp. JC2975]|uniref:toxin-antitoxin system HicB family antitoxin n=1 Tax=Planctomonas sp. JC2975 TaxID=2729626 RepID=UPI0014764265|nr:toxin-antitoxin system HicB family antitoxin [Planctomonas sp. JC2975]NNC12810.1 toxin-antitoxin system HicB family antitoxin [Planctomonas sp. JC2975]